MRDRRPGNDETTGPDSNEQCCRRSQAPTMRCGSGPGARILSTTAKAPSALSSPSTRRSGTARIGGGKTWIRRRDFEACVLPVKGLFARIDPTGHRKRRRPAPPWAGLEERTGKPIRNYSLPTSGTTGRPVPSNSWRRHRRRPRRSGSSGPARGPYRGTRRGRGCCR